MLGTVNLITTSRHYPLRLHVVRALTQLSAATNTFIPVLPLLLQVGGGHGPALVVVVAAGLWSVGTYFC